MAKTGTIFDIKKYAIHDGPGIRTTVFMKGCPLNCWWCHNPESRQAEPETFVIQRPTTEIDRSRTVRKEVIGRVVAVKEVMGVIRKDVVFYDQSGGGVTFSGGEPMMQPEFLFSLLQECRKEGIHTAVDTCGYASAEAFDGIYDLTDLFLYDLKLIDDDAHRKYTGVSNGLILENLTRLAGRGPKVTVRIPLIPGITDTDENLGAIADFIASLKNIHRVSLLPYNPLGSDKLTRFNIPDRLGRLQTQKQVDVVSRGTRFFSCGYEVKFGG